MLRGFQGRNLAAKDRCGTSDPVSVFRDVLLSTHAFIPYLHLFMGGGMLMMGAVTAVPRAYARRRETSNALDQQDIEPRMEPDVGPAHRGRAEPPPRSCLLGQRPLWKGLHGRV